MIFNPRRFREEYRHLRRHWIRSDTWVLGTALVATLVYIGNCWWESVEITYLAALIPLAIFVWRMRIDPEPLREALIRGAILGFAWPPGEWLTARTVGWWGEYTAPGLRILETPLYCVLIGWLATAYIVYTARRLHAIGYPRRGVAAYCGFTAFATGVLGENLFAAAGMWRYDSSSWDWWGIPAFVPIAYGLGYALLPLVPSRPLMSGQMAFLGWIGFSCIATGWVFGFYPR